MKKVFFLAEDHFYYYEFSQAIDLYLQLIEKYPDNASYKYKAGLCYLYSNKNKYKSIEYLTKAGSRINKYYLEGSFKENGAPEDIYFYLGIAYHINDLLDSALIYYEKFKNILDHRNLKDIDYTNHLIEVCENGKELMKSPITFKAENMNKTLTNNATKAYMLISGNDSLKVYFIETQKSTNIYYSIKSIHGSWTKPKKIEPLSKQEEVIYPCDLYYNGSKLLFYKEVKNDGNIYEISYMNRNWDNEKKLNNNINSRFMETHASISSDGKKLYFTSDRNRGMGGLDIYISELDKNGDWGKAKNLGNTINTIYNEETPYISNDDKTLFFSSEGHYNIGGYDIFYSNVDTANHWSSPINIGYPINTTEDNLFFVPAGTSDIAYYAMPSRINKLNVEILKINILSEELRGEIQLNGNITLQGSKYSTLDNIKVSITRADNENQMLLTPSPAGLYKLDIEKGIRYKLKITSDNYETLESYIDVPTSYSRDKYFLNTQLIPREVAEGKYIAIKSVFFNFDSYYLSGEAITDMERVAGFLIKNKDLTCEITGYTDSKGTTIYNKVLRARRMNSVLDYLIKKGIHKDRLIIQDYNDSLLSIKNSNITSLLANYERRVDIKIVNSNEGSYGNNALFIPEYLKTNIQHPYTIQLFKSNDETDTLLLKSSLFVKHKITKHESPDGPIYTTGKFRTIGKAAPMLDTCLELGFNNARIINYQKVYELIKGNHDIIVSEPKPVYTIQILASKRPAKEGYLKIKKINLSISDDGMYRYTFGEFNSYLDAKDVLLKKVKLIYPSSFIKKIEDIPNYRVSY